MQDVKHKHLEKRKKLNSIDWRLWETIKQVKFINATRDMKEWGKKKGDEK